MVGLSFLPLRKERNKLKAHVLFLCILLPSLLLNSPCADAYDALVRIKETKLITIAHREAIVPISYLSDESKPLGYAMEICGKIVDRLKRELKLSQLSINYLLVNPGNRFNAIVEGKADLECGATANTVERRKQVAFSIPYFYAASRILVSANSEIKNWSDLNGKRVITVRGSTASSLLKQNAWIKFAELKLLEVATSHSAFEMLETHQADAIVMEELSLSGLRASSKKPDQWKLTGDIVGIEAYALMLAKEEIALKVMVDKEIARMMSDGEFAKIYDKWFTQALPASGINYELSMGFLLRNSTKFPSDRVPGQ
jgi:ABC-type amino acid transport substrate-binding protein